MSKGVLALTTDHTLTFCVAPPEKRGQGRCNHIAHIKDNEAPEEFLERVRPLMNDDKPESTKLFQRDTVAQMGDENKEHKNITQDEINDFADEIDKIAGTHVTKDNMAEVFESLDVDQMDKINKIGFKAAPLFSLPITDDNFEEKTENNMIHFADLAKEGIAGNQEAMEQIFHEVGEIPKVGGGMMKIKKSYYEGLNEEEEFNDNLVARYASISKSVSTAKPGYIARLLAYGLSDIKVMDDCGGPYIDILHCKAPEGNICRKCAAKTQGGKVVDEVQYIGGFVSTSVSADLTTMSMKKQHLTTEQAMDKDNYADNIINTYHAFKTSPIIEAAVQEKTTEGRRNALFQGLKEAYNNAGKPVDDFQLEVVVKKMTGYVSNPEGPGIIPYDGTGLCEIRSMKSLGQNSNIFKHAELETAYKLFTVPQEDDIKEDAMNKIM